MSSSKTIYEIFKGSPNIFGIADDILIVEYDYDAVTEIMIRSLDK